MKDTSRTLNNYENETKGNHPFDNKDKNSFLIKQIYFKIIVAFFAI